MVRRRTFWLIAKLLETRLDIADLLTAVGTIRLTSLIFHQSDSVLLGLSKTKSTVQRVTIDIKDLELSKVQALTTEDGKRKKVVAFSKHLCGSATDITLKCIMNYVEEQTKAGNR